MLGSQDQKRLAEAGQRKDGADADNLPVGGRQAGKTGTPYRVLPDGSGFRRRLLHSESEERNGHGAGEDRHPEHRLKVVGPQ